MKNVNNRNEFEELNELIDSVMPAPQDYDKEYNPDDYEDYIDEELEQEMIDEFEAEREEYEWEREMINLYEEVYNDNGYKFIERYKDNLCRLDTEPSAPASEYIAAIEGMKAFLQKLICIKDFDEHAAINYRIDTYWLAELRFNLENIILDYIDAIQDSEYDKYKEDSIQWLKSRLDTELNKFDDMVTIYGGQIQELIHSEIGLRELLQGDGKEYKIFFIQSTMAIMTRDIKRVYKELDNYPRHLNESLKNKLLGVEQGLYEIEMYIEAFQ